MDKDDKDNGFTVRGNPLLRCLIWENKNKWCKWTKINVTCVDWSGHQRAQSKCDKRIDTAALLALKQIATAAIHIAWIYMHTDSWSPGFNLHLQCNRQVDGHPGKWNICPSFMQLTLRAPRQGKWKQTLQMSRSHGENDLALWLKCFPPSPVWSATSIYQSNDVAKGQVNQAQLLLLLFQTDSDAESAQVQQV